MRLQMSALLLFWKVVTKVIACACGQWKLAEAVYSTRSVAVPNSFLLKVCENERLILQINKTRCTILLGIFGSLLYMFRATMCPSPGENTVSMRHWYLSLCMGGVWSAGWSETPTGRPDATHKEWQIPVSHRYSDFSWWWANGYPKHVEKKINILSRIVHLVGFICNIIQ